MSHRYYYEFRPPGIGCQPDGWTNREGGLPKSKYIVPSGLPNKEKSISAFGWVEYDEPLSFDQIYKKDLIPHDPVERAKFYLWISHDRNEETVDWLISDYQAQGRNWLLENYEIDSLAAYALILLDAEEKS